MNIHAYGRQGFANAEAAIADARTEFKVTGDLQFAVMRKGENFGWLLPLPYARRIAESNGIEIVSVETLHP